MSKVRGPLFSLDARKSIANKITFRRGRRTTHTQKKFTPYDRKTADQQSIRKAMKELQAKWKTLTSAQKEAWEEYAKIGPHKHQSGYSVFLKENFIKYHNTGTFDAFPNWDLPVVLSTGEKVKLSTGEQVVVNMGD